MKTKARPLSVVAAIALLQPLASQDVQGESRGPFPSVKLPAAAQGKAIPQALGVSFERVAKWHGKKPEDLRRHCEHDNDLRVNSRGRLFCTCAGLAIPKGAGGGGGGAAAASFPLEQTFLLHSRPGATKVIYLDFNGHTTSGTHWNTEYTGGQDIVSPAYDSDGNASQFSTTELESIQTIWQHVSEDFAAFDVDVTTEEPDIDALRKTSPQDDAYGQRVVIGGSSSWLGGSYGGVAQIGSFDDDIDLPCFVFPPGLNNGEPKATAEASSHEAGHTLGLFHDGTVAHDGIPALTYYTGHGSWAPIMGVGYYKPVTHWSKGDYPWANNQEDDLAVMQTYGLPLRADAHGDTLATGTALSGYNATLNSVIESRTDADWFSFSTAAGNIYLGALGALPSPNLDAELSLFDNTGALISTSTTSSPPGTLDAELFATVAAGTYHVRLDGIGAGSLSTGYDDYSSIAQYQLDTLIVPTSGGPPVAVADASGPVSGPAALTVNFSSAGSYDPNGTITGYQWDFGDGQTSTQANPAHTYATKGLYTTTLVVTDNTGLPAMDFVPVNVGSALPIAVVNTIPSRGVAPQGVIINAQGSYDPDGTIVTYHWNFGDGQTFTGQHPGVHTYQNAGVYNVTLTLTDNDGAVGTDTEPLVIFPTNTAIYVESINMSLNNLTGGFKSANAAVKIVRFDGTPMRNANVTVTWSGLVTGTKTAKTNTQGIATITSNKSNASGTFTATVTNVVLTGNPYFAPGNLETSDSISTP